MSKRSITDLYTGKTTHYNEWLKLKDKERAEEESFRPYVCDYGKRGDLTLDYNITYSNDSTYLDCEGYDCYPCLSLGDPSTFSMDLFQPMEPDGFWMLVIGMSDASDVILYSSIVDALNNIERWSGLISYLQ